MLIEFSIENFKSIKDRVTFTMSADEDDLTHNENCYNSALGLSLLKSALIYGANASGKSSFVESIAVLQKIIRTSAKYTPEDRFPVFPFRLSKKCIDEPTNFDIHFIFNGCHYNYQLSINSYKVLAENLYLFNNDTSNAIFLRTNNNVELASNNEDDLETAMRQKIIKENLADNILFLSQANNINNAHIKNAFYWFSKKLFLMNQLFQNPLTREFLDHKIIDKETVLDFLKNADPFIADLSLSTEETMFPAGSLSYIKQIIAKENNIPIEKLNFEKAEVLKEFTERYSIDKNDNTLVKFDMNEESMGTRKYYNLLGPIIRAIKEGNIIICDEFENSLHHLLVMNIFKYFLSENNAQGAQLIATTHDVLLLSEELFRNDQIWFVNKNYQAASELYSLSEIETPPSRKDLLREYLRGTLGGVNPRL